MRWYSSKLVNGDRRVRSGFLFFPKKIGKETRWLEFAHWEEIVDWDVYRKGHPFKWYPNRWVSPVPINPE